MEVVVDVDLRNISSGWDQEDEGGAYGDAWICRLVCTWDRNLWWVGIASSSNLDLSTT